MTERSTSTEVPHPKALTMMNAAAAAAGLSTKTSTVRRSRRAPNCRPYVRALPFIGPLLPRQPLVQRALRWAEDWNPTSDWLLLDSWSVGFSDWMRVWREGCEDQGRRNAGRDYPSSSLTLGWSSRAVCLGRAQDVNLHISPRQHANDLMSTLCCSPLARYLRPTRSLPPLLFLVFAKMATS